uniref:Uncharacterized protein n=1 Tax=Graphocephala atropunctata TaxID=36148 RepID=A0A1B6KBB7_9HEMI
MKSSQLSVICLVTLVATGRCCMVGGIWRVGGPYYDDYDYGARGRFRNGYGNTGYGTTGYSNTGYGNTGFVGYGVGLGGLGLLLSLLFHPHLNSHFHPPPPREVHHHHHYFHQESGGYDYKYSRDSSYRSRSSPSGSQGASPGDNKRPNGFSSFFKNMFYK